ncbi:response regulator [Psychromonas sp. CNPT3]|uniref:response regulator n=1 Tax=Psychromonas sp. CNPT3 TaxID=314282 RepID=UPI00006E83F3|nr:response regulator [Psychromonas sp. CNPT3]AGH82270.1 response regulator [Psychromonas sp. CNPT3]
MNDEILFIEEDNDSDAILPSLRLAPWKVMLVDDDLEVHAVTKLVLSSFEWDGRTLEFLSAYSAAQAEEMFQEHDDIAVALIDVVMETDDAGLRLIKNIRNKLKNHTTRIVLRTGQPGQAPERKIIREYNISDYKNKTELSGVKLDTLMCSALRSYQNIISLKKSKNSLQIIANSSAQLIKARTYNVLVNETIHYLSLLVEQCTQGNSTDFSTLGIYCDQNTFQLSGAQGKFTQLAQFNDISLLPDNVSILISKSLAEKTNIFTENAFILNMHSSNNSCILFYVEGFTPLSDTDITWIEVFARNTQTSFDNEELRNAVDEGQREIIYLLGEAIEKKSKETGNHIRRVAEISYILALELGYSISDAEKIKSASPLHDLGKIGIPDCILHKPGSLTAEEWKTMQTHVEIGYELVRYSQQDILKFAAVICYQHHEKWDGSGYPNGLKGEEIDLVGRLASLADVFDALAHDRCYKKAWPMDEILKFIDDQEGKHFDPLVVAAFRKHQQEIINVNERYRDIF